CDHPLLDPVGACRQCLVEVPDMGNGRGMPKPQASCTLECAPGMKINTQVTSPVAEKAQAGMLEFLLVNHPLDCPICDKGGECPLQNQALSNGNGESRYEGVKRTFPKPVPVSAQVLLDRERCVLCARCTRFSEQIAGDPFIALVERGALQQVGKYAEHPYNSYFSGNVIQICPVGALTSVSYRFQSRPFDLVSTDSTCEHCAGGCALRVDHRHFQVKRRLAGANPAVNEEWNCDKGRFAFVSGRGEDRVTRPLVRRDGVLKVASWPEAIDAAVAGLRAAGSSAGVLTGGRLTVENAYGYSKFARAVLGTNNIDFRSRPASAEETIFLTTQVAGRGLGDGVTYADLEAAKRVVLVCLEPEEEAAAIFLRLRKAVRKHKVQVVTLAPYASNGSVKLNATVVPTGPGDEAAALAGVELDADTLVLVGERAATSPGTLAAVVAKAESAGARFAWVPRRAGDRGAVEVGCLPTLLPGGRAVHDAAARVDVAAAWGVETLPSEPGLDATGILSAAESGELQALVVGGLEPRDFASAQQVRDALESAGFVVSLESRLSEVTERADVVFPVALIEEHAGTFWNWEHRPGVVNTVIRQANTPMTDLRVLAALADAMGTSLGVRTVDQAATEFAELGSWEGPRPVPAGKPNGAKPRANGRSAGFRVATWRQLLDGGRGMDGEAALAETAKPAVARVSPATAAKAGLAHGGEVTVVTDAGGFFTLPLEVAEDMVDGAVWVPTNAPGVSLGEFGVLAGDTVQLNLGGVA
ncbi:MAG: NADH-quinone oxidoreductase subunit G, partial [Propionicimonas sp.]